MIFYDDEQLAMFDLKTVIGGHASSAHIVVFERIARDEAVDDVIFGVRMKSGDSKILPIINSLKAFHIESEKSLRYEGTKLDMMGDAPTEYILVRSTVIS